MKQLYLVLIILFSVVVSAQKNDDIIGVWEVKTNNFQAIYEIEESHGKFIGKVHYYNDGETEYKGSNTKEDYFLSEVIKKDDKYINGKMYLPDGSYYYVIFTFKDKDVLEVLMTLDDKPYKETWKRITKYN